MRYKVSQLQDLITFNGIDVLALSETWLTENIADNEVCLAGYRLFRFDRKVQSCRLEDHDSAYSAVHGGVCIFVKDHLRAVPVNIDVDPSLEILPIRLTSYKHLPDYIAGSPGAAQQLSVLQLNARSIMPKLSELTTIASSLRSHIIAVTETWLSSSVTDGVILLPNDGTFVRADRSSPEKPRRSRGGGSSCSFVTTCSASPTPTCASGLKACGSSCDWKPASVSNPPFLLLLLCLRR